MNNLSYGLPVACLIDGAIRFGVVTEILQRINRNGHNTEVMVESIDANGEPDRFLISRPALICEASDSWGYGDPANLVKESMQYQWALKKSEEILNPPVEPAEPAPAVAEAAPVVEATPPQVDTARPADEDTNVPGAL